MRALRAAVISVVACSTIAGSSWAQDPGSPYLMRMERQSHDENVCILLQKDGHYHLERIITGRPRVFEGTLAMSAVGELEPLLNADQLVNLKQSQIEMTLVSEDMDAVIITIPRPSGWQSLNFPGGKSRKPFKTTMDPLLKWLDRNKQQQNPIVGASTTRCIPPQTAAASDKPKPNLANPYIMRIVVDHYEPVQSGDSQAGTHYAGFKVTRQCTIVYEGGRYRMEKSLQESNSEIRSDIYRDTLDKSQLEELRQLLNDPKLVALPNSAPPTVFAREGDLVSLAVPRDTGVQMLSFASAFGARTKEQGMKDNMALAVSANVELTHPLTKWIKQNVESRKGTQVKDVPSTKCVPTEQPE